MQLVNNGVPYNASSVVHSFSSRKEAFSKIPAMISSIRSIAKTARNYVQLALLFSANPGQSTSASCPNAQLSCSSGATTTNYCCFNYPGGLLLQTQFWDTNPPTGPSDSWTIHGLWSVHLWLLQIIFPIDLPLGQTTAMVPMKPAIPSCLLPLHSPYPLSTSSYLHLLDCFYPLSSLVALLLSKHPTRLTFYNSEIAYYFEQLTLPLIYSYTY